LHLFVEQYHAELLAQPYTRVGDAMLAKLRQRKAEGHHSNAIEGIHLTSELMALFATFLEECAPPDVSGPYVHRYIMERIVPMDRALAAKRLSSQM
jgi:hypothetical protein